MGVSRNHPFIARILHEIDHPAIFGYPHDYGNLHIIFNPHDLVRYIHHKPSNSSQFLVNPWGNSGAPCAARRAPRLNGTSRGGCSTEKPPTECR